MHIIRILKITEESNFNTIVCTVKTCQKEGRELKFFYTLKLLQLLEEGVPRCYSSITKGPLTGVDLCMGSTVGLFFFFY